MRKVKMLTTIISLVLMVALLAFGVYAAKTVTFTVGANVTFTVSDVYIEVYYGQEGATPSGPYYTDEKTSEPKLKAEDKLPDLSFTDQVLELEYFISVKNLHDMDIHLRFGYEWTGSSKYSANDTSKEAVSVIAKIAEADESGNYDFESQTAITNNKTPTTDANTGIRTDVISGTTPDYSVSAQSTNKFKITLILNKPATSYVLNGGLQLKMKAALEAITEI